MPLRSEGPGTLQGLLGEPSPCSPWGGAAVSPVLMLPLPLVLSEAPRFPQSDWQVSNASFSSSTHLTLRCTLESPGEFERFWCLGVSAMGSGLIGLGHWCLHELPRGFSCEAKAESHCLPGCSTHGSAGVSSSVPAPSGSWTSRTYWSLVSLALSFMYTSWKGRLGRSSWILSLTDSQEKLEEV